MFYGELTREEGFPFTGRKLEKLKNFLKEEGLDYDDTVSYSTWLEEDDGTIAASGSISGNVLKCIAVADAHQGEGLSAWIVTELMKQAMEEGKSHLFLFTKPKNQQMFSDLGFDSILCTDDILFMENKKEGIASYVHDLKASCAKEIATFEEENGRPAVQGAIVANCNPFTRGHRYLIEEALKRCDYLHLFILSEDKSEFSTQERFAMVRKGTEDLDRIFLHPTSDYLVSSATFPTYFIKDKAKAAQAGCELDVRIFAKCIAKPLGITKRFVGTESTDEVTRKYNETMKEILPQYGIELIEIPRLAFDGVPISAKTVRQGLKTGKTPEELTGLIPASTAEFIIGSERI